MFCACVCKRVGVCGCVWSCVCYPGSCYCLAQGYKVCLYEHAYIYVHTFTHTGSGGILANSDRAKRKLLPMEHYKDQVGLPPIPSAAYAYVIHAYMYIHTKIAMHSCNCCVTMVKPHGNMHYYGDVTFKCIILYNIW